MSIDQEAVELLLEALSSHHAGFILGAGASAPEVPVMGELIERVLRSFKQHVHGFVSCGDHTPTHYLLANAARDEETRQKLLASNINTLRLLIARELQPDNRWLQKPPVQYDVLSRAKTRIPIVNYNVDGLATAWCRQSGVTPIHGEVPDFVRHLPIENAVYLTQEGLEILDQDSFWLPEPESEPELLHSIDAAYRGMMRASTLIIIGYSFGWSSDGFMDQVSLRALEEYCRAQQTTVLVVDPRARDLAEMLAETLRNSGIRSLPVRWNQLCRALSTAQGTSRVSGLRRMKIQIPDVIKRYKRLVGESDQ